MTVHDLSPRAKRAIAELHDEFKQKLMPKGIMAPVGYYDKLSREYGERLKSILRGSFESVDNDRLVRVSCPLCGQSGSARGDQKRFSCCGIDHYTFANLEEK